MQGGEKATEKKKVRLGSTLDYHLDSLN